MSTSSSSTTTTLYHPRTTTTTNNTLISRRLFSIEESELFHNLNLLVESRDPPYLKLIIQSLYESPFSISEMEKIFYEDILPLGWIPKLSYLQDSNWRKRREEEIFNLRLDRLLLFENTTTSNGNGNGRNYFWKNWIIKSLEWNKSFWSLGEYWEEDSIENFNYVKRELKKMELNERPLIERRYSWDLTPPVSSAIDSYIGSGISSNQEEEEMEGV